MSHLARYWAWTAAYVVAIIWLFTFTDLHLSWWQVGLLILAINLNGAAERNGERARQSRKPVPREAR